MRYLSILRKSGCTQCFYPILRIIDICIFTERVACEFWLWNTQVHHIEGLDFMNMFCKSELFSVLIVIVTIFEMF